MPLTTAQLNSMQVTKRVASSCSILGSLFIIFTYLASSAFRKPINRLVFYASWGNLVANISIMISRTGAEADANETLCQFQAFLNQMFLPADSLWTLAMAFNVYLALFRRYSASQLRQQEWKYFIICYGIPFIPAITFVFARSEARGRIFGPAILWCWITAEWNFLRIAFFYGPVWAILLTAMSIYAVIGRVIYKNHRQFRNIPRSNLSSNTDSAAGPKRAHPYFNTHFKPAIPSVDRAAWAYMKIALLFYAAMLITWVVPTINRIYTFVNSQAVSFPLNYMVALVLPLQGFWNAIIYVSTSIPACRALWATLSSASHREAMRSEAANAKSESMRLGGLPVCLTV